MTNLKTVFRDVKAIKIGLHSSGTFSDAAFDAIYHHLRDRTVVHSIETGSGASTLLFSHLSQHHLVFARDCENGSVTNIRRHPLLKTDTVTFVEGPTQKTLPTHLFTQPLQLALLDGPHGYPFPDLEYFYIYPHLEPGALLIVDDIHIRSVYNLFRFLRADEMFNCDQVVDTTAFFRRTDAPVFDPYGDGWWEQAYNKTVPIRFMATPLRPFIRRSMKSALPQPAFEMLRRFKSRLIPPSSIED